MPEPPATAAGGGAGANDADMAEETAQPTPDAPDPDRVPEIQFDDFVKLDLRVCTVREATDHPNADKLLLLKLDDGTEAGRQICAGIKGKYDPEQLVGRQIVVVANLAPRKMRGEVSQGMLLAASSDDRSTVVVVGPQGEVPAGSSVG